MTFINLSFWRRRLFALTTKIYPAILRKVYGMDIGKNCVISRKARLDRAVNPKGVHVGDGTWILAGAGVLSHDVCRSLKTDTYVGNNCVIGIRSLILPGVKVGDSTVVAACSVVTKNTPPPLHSCRKSGKSHQDWCSCEEWKDCRARSKC